MPRWNSLGRGRTASRMTWRIATAVVILELVTGGALYATEGTPSIVLRRTLAASLTIPGRAPELAWPARGEAAIAVSGLGTLGSVGGDQPVPITSMAKMMTAYLTLLTYPLVVGRAGFTYTVTAADVGDSNHRVALDQSTLDVAAGEQLSEYQLLEGLMIPSGNNVAAILARLENTAAYPASWAR